MAILSYGYVLDANREGLETTVRHPKAGRKTKMRLISEDIGQSLEEVKSLSQFLRVMYDACVGESHITLQNPWAGVPKVQRNLYRKCQVLHRDINDNNIMVAPTDLEFKKHCGGKCYGGVKYLNQILAKDINAKSEPACLVVDVGDGANLNQIDENAKALAGRTGTPKFIARAVSQGDLLSYLPGGLAMPTLEGRALELYKFSNEAEYTKYTEAVQERAHVPATPQVEHKHQLFHDAESTFWVIAWTLARSAPGDYRKEETWPPRLIRFVATMETHQPGPDAADGRDGFHGLNSWTAILHPSLASVTGMLLQMHSYVRPEWQHRPKLNVEHVHEALMRLLLTEIVRIEDFGGDVELVVGGRELHQPVTMMLNMHLEVPQSGAPDAKPQASTGPPKAACNQQTLANDSLNPP
ncbi:hypothetical protein FRC10_000969 [Ceratobasidium sp. 414]|nr:hypothetical protein FRC10_000969 [Ceratobasidium sp. 414]